MTAPIRTHSTDFPSTSGRHGSYPSGPSPNAMYSCSSREFAAVRRRPNSRPYRLCVPVLHPTKRLHISTELFYEYDIPARDLSIVHYRQRLYDGYSNGMFNGARTECGSLVALEEDKRTDARERAEGQVQGRLERWSPTPHRTSKVGCEAQQVVRIVTQAYSK